MAGPMPRPWFRLGSFTRPASTATPAAPAPEQPRPIPARIRPLLLRPPAVTDPSQPTTPQPAKSPSQLPRPAQPTLTVKKEPLSPPPPPPTAAKTLTKPVLPMLSGPVVPSPSKVPNADTAAAKPSSPKGRSSSVAGSPPKSELFDKDSIKNPSPVPSPPIPKSIRPVPSPHPSPKPKAAASPPSPKPKAAASPPSPLLLPPPQLQPDSEPPVETIPKEVERKTVVFQKVMEKPSPPDDDHKNKKQEPKKNDTNKEKEKGNGAKKAEEKDSSPRVITMAGENRGAVMEVVLSDKNANGENKDKESKKKSTGTRNARPMKAFCNSNVQGINNSILMNSEFSHHDPGIHLVFSRMPPVDREDEDEDKKQQ